MDDDEGIALRSTSRDHIMPFRMSIDRQSSLIAGSIAYLRSSVYSHTEHRTCSTKTPPATIIFGNPQTSMKLSKYIRIKEPSLYHSSLPIKTKTLISRPLGRVYRTRSRHQSVPSACTLLKSRPARKKKKKKS